MGLRQLILSKPCSKHTLQGAGVDEDVFLQHLLVLELGSRMRENRHKSKRGCVLRGWQCKVWDVDLSSCGWKGAVLVWE